MTQIKQPAEVRYFDYDFTAALNGNMIASVVSAVSEARGDIVGSTALVKDAQDNDTTKVRVKWSGGSNGETYLTTVKITDTAGQTHELEGEIYVADLKFALPAGISATYLTAEEYVARFGAVETRQLTDTRRSGTIDAGMLGAALSDATQLVDSYAGSRYALPLSPVPGVVKQIVADIARERLHNDTPTPQVTARADNARKMLQDIAKGVIVLGTTATIPDADYTATPTYFSGDQVFTDETLALF